MGSGYDSDMQRNHHLQIARLGQALASPVRLRALNLLAQRAWRVGELGIELGESLAATSAHLKTLRAAGMVANEKRGREVWCRVESDEVLRLLAAAERAAEGLLPEMREAVREANADPYLLRGEQLHELARKVAGGKVLLIDLRPDDEFQAGHLPGAESYPFPRLETLDLKPLRDKSPIVAYCRGPWCRMARQGVNRLNERGIPAKRLRLGLVQWRAEGLDWIQPPPSNQNPPTDS